MGPWNEEVLSTVNLEMQWKWFSVPWPFSLPSHIGWLSLLHAPTVPQALLSHCFVFVFVITHWSGTPPGPGIQLVLSKSLQTNGKNEERKGRREQGKDTLTFPCHLHKIASSNQPSLLLPAFLCRAFLSEIILHIYVFTCLLWLPLLQKSISSMEIGNLASGSPLYPQFPEPSFANGRSSINYWMSGLISQ